MSAVQSDYGNMKPGRPMKRNGKTYYRCAFANGDVEVKNEDRRVIRRVRDGSLLTDDELLDMVLPSG